MISADKTKDKYRAPRCICGRTKQQARPFCSKCNSSLPPGVKAGVMSVAGVLPNWETRALAYFDCVQFLEEQTILREGAADGISK